MLSRYCVQQFITILYILLLSQKKSTQINCTSNCSLHSCVLMLSICRRTPRVSCGLRMWRAAQMQTRLVHAAWLCCCACSNGAASACPTLCWPWLPACRSAQASYAHAALIRRKHASIAHCIGPMHNHIQYAAHAANLMHCGCELESHHQSYVHVKPITGASATIHEPVTAI